jgi:hypothetical protein
MGTYDGLLEQADINRERDEKRMEEEMSKAKSCAQAAYNKAYVDYLNTYCPVWKEKQDREAAELDRQIRELQQKKETLYKTH